MAITRLWCWRRENSKFRSDLPDSKLISAGSCRNSPAWIFARWAKVRWSCWHVWRMMVNCSWQKNLSQGTLYLLAILTRAHAPVPPDIVCIEEEDRGVHPRLLREVRDALYRLSYPLEGAGERASVQVIATTHSPFERLSDRADIIEPMKEAHLGDLWYSGSLGAVPGE